MTGGIDILEFTKRPVVAPTETPPQISVLEFTKLPVMPYSPKGYNIDFNRPDEDVRAQIRTLSPEQREMALRDWADVYVAREHKESPILQGVNDRVRAVARGVPIVGPFSDEIVAGTQALGAGADYDEALAYQRGKDRYYDKQEPIGSLGWKLLGGVGTYGGAAGPALGTELNAGRGLIADAATGYVSGFGEGEGSDRVSSGVRDAALSTALSGAFRLPGAVARPFRNVPENIDPNVANAAAETGVNLPFFARARPDASGNSTAARWAARLQGMPVVGDPISGGYQAGRESVANMIADQATTAARNADVRAAPATAGAVAATGMTDASQALREQIQGVSQSLESQFSPGTFDPNQVRSVADVLVQSRAAAPGVPESPFLTRTANDLQAPVDYPATHQARDFVGDQIGVPRAGEMASMQDAELTQLYAAYTRQLEEHATQLGIRPQFDNAQTVIRELSDVRREIRDALSGDSSSLISRLANWGSAKGTGVNENAFNTVVSSLSPEQRQQVAGGVLAHMCNIANGSPQQVATMLSRMPSTMRNRLFAESGLPVEDIVTLGQTLERVNQGRNWSGTSGASTAVDVLLKAGAPLIAGYHALTGSGGLSDIIGSGATAAAPFALGPTVGRTFVEGLPATPGIDAAAQTLAPAIAQSAGRGIAGTEDPRLTRRR